MGREARINMKALVVGASGLVGGALMRVLEQSGIEALGTFHTHAQPGLVSLDIRNRGEITPLFDQFQPTVIFNTTNLAVDYCELHPQRGRDFFLTGTSYLLAEAARRRALVVHYSTAYIFSGIDGPYGEENEAAPRNAYGKMKRDAEIMVSPSHLIIRTMNVFGWGKTSNNFAMQVWNSLHSGKAFSAATDQIGNPTLVEYLAETSLRLVQEGARGIFHVVGKEAMSRFAFAEAIARATSLDGGMILSRTTEELNQKAPRPLNVELKTDKVFRFLETEPLALSESLKRFRRQWRADTHTSHSSIIKGDKAEFLKHEILEKVREYHTLTHKLQPFVPYKSRIQYSGRVFGEEEMVNLVESGLDFWLTLGPYGDFFEKNMKD